MPMLCEGDFAAAEAGAAAGGGVGAFCAEAIGIRISAEEMRKSLTEVPPWNHSLPGAEELLLLEVTVAWPWADEGDSGVMAQSAGT